MSDASLELIISLAATLFAPQATLKLFSQHGGNFIIAICIKTIGLEVELLRQPLVVLSL